MLRWYTVAADANSTEGLFLLGWAHHRGVGTDRNLTKAAELYLRAIQMAGKKNRARAVASMLGLLAMRLDVMLQPLFGEDATERAAEFLAQRLLSRSPPPGRPRAAPMGASEVHDVAADEGWGAADRGGPGSAEEGGGGEVTGSRKEEFRVWIGIILARLGKQVPQLLSDFFSSVGSIMQHWVGAASPVFRGRLERMARQVEDIVSSLAEWAVSDYEDSDLENVLALAMLAALALVLAHMRRLRQRRLQAEGVL